MYALATVPQPVSIRSRYMPTRAEINQARAAEYARFDALAKPHLDRMRMYNTLIEPEPLRRLKADHTQRLADIDQGRI